uniref:ATP-dependent DNA ligase family profile domain-containing protein n=2 Tax=Kalmanozyma brasiliensis (strain GHG001) TaxID=1365824 RepID=V5ET69_KALBG
MAVVRNFLDQHGIIEQHDYALKPADDADAKSSDLFRRGLLRPTSLEIFYRCLDRNLKAGFGERILRQAFAGIPLPQRQSWRKEDPRQKNRTVDPLTLIRQTFDVALGKPVTRDELPSLFEDKEAPAWYASRKLDGVRCLFVVRLQREDAASAGWKVSSILALSRNARPFTALSVLEKELAQKLPAFPGLTDLLASAHENSDDNSSTATLILDGEVCILRPAEQASESAVKQLDAALSATSQDATEHTMVEDFAAVVGLIKRHNYTIREPAFFPFDLLTMEEFSQWRENTTESSKARTFAQRLQPLEALVSHFEADAREQGKPSIVRRLSQNRVTSTDQVEQMLATASQRGWEGIVLRQDTPYEGKRSKAIRKFKEWKDAEYTVLAITVATMRLPIDGRFEEREAMASIQIEHRGTKVSVGSGFTPEQRVQFAKEPDGIVGKVVTVEYFDESKTMGSASNGGVRQEVYSLRFPRIKHIWGKERDV